MAPKPSVIAFAGRREMAARLADVIVEALGRAIGERGSASIAISGGSTPEGLYKELSSRDLDWACVTAVLMDERWVAPGEAGSNETFARNTLVQNKAKDVSLLGLWSPAESPVEGLPLAIDRMSTAQQPFDVAVLGMGGDGHTASWFPYAQGLDEALAPNAPPLAAITANQSEVTGEFFRSHDHDIADCRRRAFCMSVDRWR